MQQAMLRDDAQERKEERADASHQGDEVLAKKGTYVESDARTDEGSSEELLQWQRVKARLKAALGDDGFRSWFAGVHFIAIAESSVQLEVPSRFIRNWILSHYDDRLRAFWALENDSIQEVELVLASERPKQEEQKEFTELGAVSAGLTSEEAEESGLPTPKAENVNQGFASAPALPTSSTLIGKSIDGSLEAAQVGAPLDSRFTFDDFVVGPSNELAFAAAKRVALEPASAFNPLYIYGQVGIGKTHLLHSVAWEMRKKNPDAKILYLSAEQFMYRFVQALRDRETMTFKEQFRGVDILLLDDVQFIANKESTQEEFFHTFDALISQNKQVVISADRSPSELEGVGERIRSRLEQGLAVDLGATNFELRLGILERKLEKIQRRNSADIQVPRNVMEFLAHRIVSNVRALEGALTRITAHTALVGRPVTLDLTKEILADLLRSTDRKLTIDDIQRCVSKYFSLNLSEMMSARRAREVARPRQIAMYLCKKLTTRSLPEIGRKFGGRDHTTVIHAVRKIEQLCAEDATIEGDIEALKRQLGAVQGNA